MALFLNGMLGMRDILNMASYRANGSPARRYILSPTYSSIALWPYGPASSFTNWPVSDALSQMSDAALTSCDSIEANECHAIRVTSRDFLDRLRLEALAPWL